jgi:sulfate transport system permease protein
MSRRISPVIPGFGLTLGYTLVYLSLIVLIPLAAMFIHASQLTWEQFWNIISAPRVLAALKLSFGTALFAAIINGVIGTLLAWVLVRYTFPGRKIIDAMIDLPFALPTAVAGIALTALYAPRAGRPVRHRPGLQDRLHPAGHHPGADLRHPAVRGAHGAAGAGRHPA